MLYFVDSPVTALPQASHDGVIVAETIRLQNSEGLDVDFNIIKHSWTVTFLSFGTVQKSIHVLIIIILLVAKR